MNILKVTSTFINKLGKIGLLVLMSLTIITLIFAVDWQPSPKPAIGVVYEYSFDGTDTIMSELKEIQNDGFQIVCIPFVWSSNPQDSSRIKTDVLLGKAQQLGLKVYVRQPNTPNNLEQYLAIYAKQISYVQVINEADAWLIHEWNVPAELASIAQENAEVTKNANPNIKTVASFVSPFIYSLITDIANHVDIIALDIYEDIQLDTFGVQLQALLTASNKNTIWIGEFGYATLDGNAQATFMTRGLDIFRKNSVESVIIWEWKQNPSLMIKGRPSETAVKTWVEDCS
jgi:hypothetical protein